MRFFVITIFPELFSCLNFGVLGRAIEAGRVEVVLVNPRDFTEDRHRTVDDEPYGGGAGMVMKPEPLVKAIEYVREKAPDAKVFLLSPKGKPFNSRMAKELAGIEDICLVCGRYEGVDERVSFFVDDLISVGDFVLSGGEFAACCIIDAVSRFVPEVLGCRDSLTDESFEGGLLEYPQFTRPRVFRGYKVPEVLLSGDHARIGKWRRLQQVKETFFKRPDLLARAALSDEDKRMLFQIIKGKEWE